MKIRMTAMAMAMYAFAILGSAAPTYADTAKAALYSRLSKSPLLTQTPATTVRPVGSALRNIPAIQTPIHTMQ